MSSIDPLIISLVADTMVLKDDLGSSHVRLAFRVADVVDNDVLYDAFNSGEGDCYTFDEHTAGEQWTVIYSVLGDDDTYEIDNLVVPNTAIVWIEKSSLV